ncbi:hypothetical protein Lal_00001511 [Lupinus albus]|nr:hypothetical protein Lal_00001511 [Lupinus albus]
MRESDDEAIRRSRIFVDTREGATKEGGDIAIPLKSGVIDADDILAELKDFATDRDRESDSLMTAVNSQLPKLPVTDVLPELGRALQEGSRAVLSAPPGAGKTTLVPLYLLEQPWCTGKIILLEPRRLAARAAAGRMASLLGEAVGDTVGYRMRLDNRISAATRIEVVTEGVFARMILDDPELNGISAVLFDEFHERSLDADFGLALALDAQSALREDLKLLVMSATLDVERVAALLDEAPVIKSEGRSFPIDIRHSDRAPQERVEDATARAILEAHASESGSILAFLPGQAEILRTKERLEQKLPASTVLVPLYGNLSQKEQDLAIKPAPEGTRKIVLATSIAETSITIDGVRIVIDSGLQRLPVFEPSTGITRLETVRASRASADQRAGRAGRTEPGIAVRLWHAGQTAALPAFTPPQILASDLSALALDLAHWGVRDPADLRFLDQPPAPALKEARDLLRMMGALDGQDGITEMGRQMRSLSLPPRLAAMAIAGAASGHASAACQLAVLMTEQGLGGPSIDLDDRLRSFRNERGERAESARKLAARLAASLPKASTETNEPASAGALLLHAYPDRVAIQRGGRGRFVMANGRGAELPETERLAASRMLVIADLTGRAAQARILAAAEIDRATVEEELGPAIIRADESVFDLQSRQVRARKVVRLGALVLEETPLPAQRDRRRLKPLPRASGCLGLKPCRFPRMRNSCVNALAFSTGPSEHPGRMLVMRRCWSSWRLGASIIDPARGDARSGPPGADAFRCPTGQRHPIRYDGDEPVLAIRVQELFGLKAHPAVAGGRLPLLLELTSPAHRPIQTTRDLPGFWTGSWKDPAHAPANPGAPTLAGGCRSDRNSCCRRPGPAVSTAAVAGGAAGVRACDRQSGAGHPFSAHSPPGTGGVAGASCSRSPANGGSALSDGRTGQSVCPASLRSRHHILCLAAASPLACPAGFCSDLCLAAGILALCRAMASGRTVGGSSRSAAGNLVRDRLHDVVCGFYAYRVSHEATLLADALAATELVLEREKHLSQLDGLAAAAAHELGTPLATISVVAKEMERELSGDERFREDVALLRSQSERCRDILRRLTSLSADNEEHMRRLPFSSLIEEVIAPQRQFGIELVLVEKGDRAREPVGNRNAGILYGLGNLVENAVDFAQSQVILTTNHDADVVTITIEDDGEGYPADVLSHIGEPYMTTRGRENETAGGLGLGLFIAKTLLERSGATLVFENRDGGEHGARVRVSWPRSVMEMDPRDA